MPHALHILNREQLKYLDSIRHQFDMVSATHHYQGQGDREKTDTAK